MKEISFIKTSKTLLLFSLMAMFFIGCSDDDDDDELGNWVEESSFNGESRHDAVTFTIDGKGYLFGGYDGDDYYKDTWVYDLTENSWTQVSYTLELEDEDDADSDLIRVAQFPGIARKGAVGFAINGKGYVGTGYGFDEEEDDYVELKDFYEYNPATDTWTEISRFPGSSRYGAVGFAIGDQGYVGTGYDGSQQKDFYQYDPATDTWDVAPGFPGDKRQNASVFVIDDVAYVGTGLQNGTTVEDFYKFDGTTWTELTDLDDDDDNDDAFALYDGVGFAIGGKGYFATGVSGSITNQVWEYDPSNDEWEELPELEASSRQGASAFTFESEDRGFVLMGKSGSFNFDDIYELKPDETEDDDD